MTEEKKNVKDQVAQEAVNGILPMPKKKREYGLFDAFFVLSVYAGATWCYTQGGYMAGFINLKQLLTTTFGANVFFVALYMLAMMFAVRYGIDMWQWLKGALGPNGVKVIITVVILCNFPWFGVCCDIFARSITNMLALFSIYPPAWTYQLIGFICAFSGALIAILGPVALKWANRLIVPLLLAILVAVVVLGFTSVPVSELAAYQPDTSSFADPRMPYALAVESGFAFALSWSCSTAVTPRLCRKERDGYWATVGAYGIIAPFFVLAGGILGIATYLKFGEFSSDIGAMLIQLAKPSTALLILGMIVIANIGTMSTGEYMWSIVLKSAYPKANYNLLVLLLSTYAFIFVVWGKIIDYFGTMITLSALIYGPIMGVLFADYFVVRRKRIDLRAVYGVEGHEAYSYKEHKGFNLVGLSCIVLGVIAGLLIYDPITTTARCALFYYMPASLFSAIVSVAAYLAAYKIPRLNAYLLRDRDQITV